MSRNGTNSNASSGGATTFLSLTDVNESTYAGSAGAYVVVNGGASGLVFNDTPPTGATEFTQLTDAPNFITANEYVVGNSGGTALIFKSGAPSTAFINLTDCPNTYSGASAGDFVVVNPSTNGLIFSTSSPPDIPTQFIQLTDTPGTYTGSTNGEILCINSTNDGIIFSTETVQGIPHNLTDLTDCPGTLTGSKALTTNSGGSAVVLTDIINSFVQLTDCPNTITANYYVAGNSGGSALEMIPAPPSATAFTMLTDCPSTYSGSNDYYVKVNSSADGLTFVEGGSGADNLISLTDNTAGAYTSTNINEAVAINQSASGFQYSNLTMLQGGLPRFSQGMIKAYTNYPGSPGSNGFIYNASDASMGVYYYFGCNRTNYNETQYLNSYWTSVNNSGASSIYPTQGMSTIDVSPLLVGINSAHSAGAQFLVPVNSGGIPAPFASSWYFDVQCDISWRIDIGNISNNLFCMWVCPESDMINLVNHNPNGFNLAQTADYFWQNPSVVGTYPNSISEGHISKTLTLLCGSGVTFPSVNVFMAVLRSSDYNPANTFTIRSYYYIKCNYSVLGIRPGVGGSTYPSCSRATPGTLW